MNFSNIPEKQIINFLQESSGFGCVLLRNFDFISNLKDGGDIDLAFNNIKLLDTLLVRHLGPYIKIVKRSYVRKYIYIWGSIDVVSEIQWRGLNLVSYDEIQANSYIHDQIRVADNVTVFIAAVIYPLLAHSSYKAKYDNMILEYDNTTEKLVVKKCIDIFDLKINPNVSLRDFLSEFNPNSCRFALIIKKFRQDPMISLKSTIKFYAFEIFLRTKFFARNIFFKNVDKNNSKD